MKDIFAVIGAVVVLVVIFACGALGYGAYRMAVGANDAAIILNDFPATLEAIDGSFSQEQPPVIGITVVPRTEPVGQVLVVTATAVPALPTSTPQPAPTEFVLNDRGLPAMGPYSLAQVQQCQSIHDNSGLHTLPEPQKALCEQYLGVNR